MGPIHAPGSDFGTSGYFWAWAIRSIRKNMAIIGSGSVRRLVSTFFRNARWSSDQPSS
jgi:hypothetical protein